ncbi:hypothetical protein MK489_09375 [Myxococcota bacterium]|nr:hypothetical protein [Myxococcota bacterium]
MTAAPESCFVVRNNGARVEPLVAKLREVLRAEVVMKIIVGVSVAGVVELEEVPEARSAGDPEGCQGDVPPPGNLRSPPLSDESPGEKASGCSRDGDLHHIDGLTCDWGEGAR